MHKDNSNVIFEHLVISFWKKIVSYKEMQQIDK